MVRQSRGFGSPPKPELDTKQAKTAILTACKGETYKGIDALLRAVNEANRTTNLSRQTARLALAELRGEEKISPTDANIHTL